MRLRLAVLPVLAAVAGAAQPSSAAAATEFPVQLCDARTAAAGIWSPTGPLTGNVRGIECPGAGNEPTQLPATGNRGVFVLQHPAGTISSAGDPSSAFTLTVPSEFTVTGGGFAYRGGADSAAWRAFVRADGQTLAGCFPNATGTPDACAYDFVRIFFASTASPSIPAGTRTLTVGLTCSSVRANGAANSGCAGSDPNTGNRAYSAITGGALSVSDANAPTGTASLTQTRTDGQPAQWTRSSDLRFRVSGASLADVGRGVCGARLQPAGAAASSPPLKEWTVAPNTSAFRQCDGLAPDGLYDLSAGRREGVQQVELVATDGTTLASNRTVVATGTIRTDDTGPSIDAAGLPASGAPGARIKVQPAVADGLSGLASTTTAAADQGGSPIAIADDGTLTLPASGTVTVTTNAADTVGNTTSSARSIAVDAPGAGTPPPPPPPPPSTTPTVPGTGTTPTPGTTTPKPPTSPTGCAAAKRSSVSTARWSRRTRRLQLQGCRVRRQKLRVELRLTRSGRTTKGRTITRRYTLTGSGVTWRRTLRTRAGETPRSLRLLITGARPTAFRAVTRTR